MSFLGSTKYSAGALKTGYQKQSRYKRVSAGDVYIGGDRKQNGWNLNASKWVYTGGDLNAYRDHVLHDLRCHIPSLVGQTLGCWCDREETCHASVLSDLVRQYSSGELTKYSSGELTKYSSGELTKDSSTISSAVNPLLKVERVPIYKIKRVRIRRPPLEPTNVPLEPRPRIQFVKDQWIVDGTPIVGKLSVFEIMTNKITEPAPRLQPAPTPFNPVVWTLSTRALTPNIVKVLKSYKRGDADTKGWPPFVCRVARVLTNKKTKRFSLEITDDANATLKAHLASQLFEVVAERFITKDSIVYVEDYVVTLVYDEPAYQDFPDVSPDDLAIQASLATLKKRIVVITKMLKVV